MTRDETILARAARGDRYATIASDLGVSRALIAGVVYRARHYTPPRVETGKPHWTGEQTATLRRMHKEGFVAAEIGEAVNKSADAVRLQGKRMGLKWTTRARKSKAWHPTASESEAGAEKRLREGDAKLMRAIAQAIVRGDHLPRANHPQGYPRSSEENALNSQHDMSEAA